MIAKVDETELWTEDISKDTTLAEIKEKYKALDDMWMPIKKRAIEYDLRSEFVKQMDKELTKVAELRQKVEKEMDWLKKEEVEKAVKKVDEFIEDWNAKKEKQENTPGHEEPVFTKGQMEGYAERSFADLKKLSKVKKPKERKKKEKKDNKKKDTRTLEQLEEVFAKNEKSLEDLRVEKAEAVTNEEFDKADDLKIKEQKLVEQQDAIKETIALRKSEAEKKEEAKEKKDEDKKEGESKEGEKKEESKAGEKKDEEKKEEKEKESKNGDQKEGTKEEQKRDETEL